MRRDARRRGVAALALWSLAATLAAQPARGAELAFVYLEANVGGASGGHAALRLGDEVFHVQQRPGGLFALAGDDWEHFRHLYGELQNRPMHVAFVPVDDADRGRVQDAFARFEVAEEEALAHRDRLALDVAWLEALAGRRAPPALAGAGLLAAGEPADPDAAALRDRVVEMRGDDFLPGALAAARERIAERAALPDPQGLREALLWREGLLALSEARPLATDAILDVAKLPRLDDAERAALRRLEARLEASVLRLLDSRRPDRGRALLLAEARHQAARRSVASGHLVLLDPLPDDLPRVPASERLRPESYAAEATDLAAVIAAGRPVLLDPDAIDEPRLALLEEASARLLELRRAASGEPARVWPRSSTPARSAVLTLDEPRPAAIRVEASLDETRRLLARQQDLLHERYGYDVIRRNCITELVRILNGAFESREDARRALGGALDPDEIAGFIPFVLFDRVEERLRVTRVETLPSQRRRALADLLAQRDSLAVRLREAGALTATLYEPRLHDGHFLFFTDDVHWSRPLLGALNLGYAVLQGAAGLVTAPFDDGARARAAASGALFSVPELVFENVRKGSYEYVAENSIATRAPRATRVPAAGRDAPR